MDKDLLKELVQEGVDLGAEYTDVFYEEKSTKKYILLNQKMDKINYVQEKGIGIRLNANGETYYTYSNELDKESILELIHAMESNFDKPKEAKKVNFEIEQVHELEAKIPHNQYSLQNKKEYLKKIDNMLRSMDTRIEQVIVTLVEVNQKANIVTSLGKVVEDNRILTRVVIDVTAKEGEKVSSLYKTIGKSIGYELLDEIDLESKLKELKDAVINQLSAIPCPGGEMPVVIGPGFGGVIFHEACGHALEATTVADKVSTLSDKKGEKIASDSVTIIDDGTLNDLWGTSAYDDEGNKTQKNVLIENGILKNYLVDFLNSPKMNQISTGSGRRESYKYAVTSRMNNTYLQPGGASLEDMIKSISYGLYAKSMGGGSVNPATGDFNFAVEEGYIIRDGKIEEPVKGASLIGNTSDILKQVEMVGKNLEFETGYCGSISGNVPVCVGQPNIKVSKILVGGEN